MKKVCFIIPALTAGGAERVFIHLMTHLDRSRFDPLIVLFEQRGELMGELPPDLPVFTLKGRMSRYGMQWLVIFRFAMLLKRVRPDVVVSFMSYTNLVALAARILSGSVKRIKVIACERVSLSYSGGLIEDLIREIAIRFFYRQAEAVIVNARKMGDELQREYGFPSALIALVYNPVDMVRLDTLAHEGVNHQWFAGTVPVITAAGRLTTQKGFDYLIRAMRLLKSDGVECKLMVIGAGTEETNLKKLVAKLELHDRVAIIGYRSNPCKYMARSAVFVLSSLYEGFPNVLLEALAMGIPSVATKCPTGPDEIITDSENGFLVPPRDEVALAEAIKKLLRDESLRKRFSEAGKMRAQDFEVHNIVRQYEKAIEKACGGYKEN